MSEFGTKSVAKDVDSLLSGLLDNGIPADQVRSLIAFARYMENQRQQTVERPTLRVVPRMVAASRQAV